MFFTSTNLDSFQQSFFSKLLDILHPCNSYPHFIHIETTHHYTYIKSILASIMIELTIFPVCPLNLVGGCCCAPGKTLRKRPVVKNVPVICCHVLGAATFRWNNTVQLKSGMNFKYVAVLQINDFWLDASYLSMPDYLQLWNFI